MNKENVKILIDLAVEFHNHLVGEFGENDYHRNRLIASIQELGYYEIKYNSEGFITDVGNKDSEDNTSLMSISELFDAGKIQ